MCMCKQPAVAMYIARLDDQYVVKRMPLSGREHDPACPSYEPPYELSGLGPLIGSAIQIDASGKADLKLDFSLTKRGPRAAASTPTEQSEPGIRSEPRKLSLKAMLHYLWEAGELTEWRSVWAGRRGWGRVRTSLINAASQMTARGGPLSDMLYVPEVYQTEDKDGIAARRATALKGVQATGSGPRKLMMIVAEVKERAEALMFEIFSNALQNALSQQELAQLLTLLDKLATFVKREAGRDDTKLETRDSHAAK